MLSSFWIVNNNIKILTKIIDNIVLTKYQALRYSRISIYTQACLQDPSPLGNRDQEEQ